MESLFNQIGVRWTRDCLDTICPRGVRFRNASCRMVYLRITDSGIGEGGGERRLFSKKSKWRTMLIKLQLTQRSVLAVLMLAAVVCAGVHAYGGGVCSSGCSSADKFRDTDPDSGLYYGLKMPAVACSRIWSFEGGNTAGTAASTSAGSYRQRISGDNGDSCSSSGVGYAIVTGTSTMWDYKTEVFPVTCYEYCGPPKS